MTIAVVAIAVAVVSVAACAACVVGIIRCNLRIRQLRNDVRAAVWRKGPS